MDLELIQKFETKFVGEQASGAATNTVLISEPRYRDQADTAAIDDQAEWIVVAVDFSASAVQNFYLQNADGAGGRKSKTYYAAANSGTFEETWIPMGKGKPIKYTSSGTIVSIRLMVILKRYSERKPLAPVTELTI